LRVVDISSKLAHQRGRSVLLGYMIKKVKDYEMPWRDPNLWVPEFMMPVFSFIIAWVRSHYDGTEPSWKRKLLEAMLCGGLSYSGGKLVAALGLDPGFSWVIAGLVGLYGVEYVRSLGKRVVNRKVGKDD